MHAKPHEAKTISAKPPPSPRLPLALITTLGLGHLRPASGTWGSLPPAVLAGVLILTNQAGTTLWYVLLAAVTILFSIACVRFGHLAEETFGKKDPSQAVADETAGMALTLLFLPTWWAHDQRTLLAYIAGAFVLFRLTDILKLPPANQLQSIGGGWGILLDDLAAALQAGAVLIAGAWVLK